MSGRVREQVDVALQLSGEGCCPRGWAAPDQLSALGPFTHSFRETRTQWPLFEARAAQRNAITAGQAHTPREAREWPGRRRGRLGGP